MVKLQMEKLAELFSDSEKFLEFDKTHDNYNAYFLYALKYDGGLADKFTQWENLLAGESYNQIDANKLADMLANFPNLADCDTLKFYIRNKQLSTTEDLSAEQANLMFNMGFHETTRSALEEVIKSHRQTVLAKVQECLEDERVIEGIADSISNATDKESIDKEVLKSIFADIKAQMDAGTLKADSTETVHVNRAGKQEQAKDGSSRIEGQKAKYSYLLTADGQIIITPKRKTSQLLKDQQTIEQLTNDIQEQEVALSALSTELESKQKHVNLRRDERDLPSLKAQIQKEESNIEQYEAEKVNAIKSMIVKQREDYSVQLDESDLNERGRRILTGLNRQAITRLRETEKKLNTEISAKEIKVQQYEEVIDEEYKNLSSDFEKEAKGAWLNLENYSLTRIGAQLKDPTTNQRCIDAELKPALVAFQEALRNRVEMAAVIITDTKSAFYGKGPLAGDRGRALTEQYKEVINKIKTVRNRRQLVGILQGSTQALNDIDSTREPSILQDRKNSLEKVRLRNQDEIAQTQKKIREAEEQIESLGQIDSIEKLIEESTDQKNKLQEIIDLTEQFEQKQASISQLKSQIAAAKEAASKSKEQVKKSRENVAKFAGSIKKADRVVTLSLPSTMAGFQVEGQVLMHRNMDGNIPGDKQFFIKDVKSDDHRARQVASGYFLTQNKGLALVDAIDAIDAMHNRTNAQAEEPKKPIEELVQRTFAQVIAAQKRQQIMGDIKVENIFSGNPCVIFDQRDRNEKKVVFSKGQYNPLVYTPDEGRRGDRYGSVPLTISEETYEAFQLACRSAQNNGSNISYLDTFGMLGALVMAEEAYDLDQDVCKEVKKILQTMRDEFSGQKESFNLERTADNKDKLPLLHEVLCRKMKNGDTIGDALGGPKVFAIDLPNKKQKFAKLKAKEIEQLPQIFTEQLIRAEYKEEFNTASMPKIEGVSVKDRNDLITAVAAKLREGSAQQKYRTTLHKIFSKAKKRAHRKTYYSTQAKKLVDKITSSTNKVDLASMKDNIVNLKFNIQETGKQHYIQVKEALAKSLDSTEKPSSKHNSPPLK